MNNTEGSSHFYPPANIVTRSEGTLGVDYKAPMELFQHVQPWRLDLQLFYAVRALFLSASLAQAEIALSDSFDYPAGTLTMVSDGRWRHHSGAETETVNVISNRVYLTRANSEDVHAELRGQPYTPGSDAVLYARLTINVTNATPGTNGTYFAHFRGGPTRSSHYCRIFLGKFGAAPGLFRFAVANHDDSPSATNKMDLSFETDYAVVVRYLVRNASTTLWINPVSEFDACAVATDVHPAIDVADFAFRQSSDMDGMGRLFVDDLVVGTTFGDVVTNAPSVMPFAFTSIGVTNQGLLLKWETSCGWRYDVEASSNLTSWTGFAPNVIATGTNFTLSTNVESGLRFFRVSRFP